MNQDASADARSPQGTLADDRPRPLTARLRGSVALPKWWPERGRNISQPNTMCGMSAPPRLSVGWEP